MGDEIFGMLLRLPLPDEQVFRYEAADDILELLYRNPHRAFTITELRDTTGHGGKSVANAIEILGSLDLVEKTRDGRRTLVEINHERIEKPDDPLLEIPQAEFRPPVREFLDRVRDTRGDTLAGVVLFGSVARGGADRASDIDLQVIVRDDLTAARRELQEVRQEVESKRFEGQRYELELLVESVESAKNHGEKLRELFSEGIVLHSTDSLDEVREVVFDGEQ